MPDVQNVNNETVLVIPPVLSWMRTWVFSIVITCEGPTAPIVSGGIVESLSGRAWKLARGTDRKDPCRHRLAPGMRGRAARRAARARPRPRQSRGRGRPPMLRDGALLRCERGCERFPLHHLRQAASPCRLYRDRLLRLRRSSREDDPENHEDQALWQHRIEPGSGRDSCAWAYTPSRNVGHARRRSCLTGQSWEPLSRQARARRCSPITPSMLERQLNSHVRSED